MDVSYSATAKTVTQQSDDLIGSGSSQLSVSYKAL